MQHIEIKIVNTRWMQMGGGDPLKQIEERAAELERIRKAEEARQAAGGGYAYQESWNPFPKFLRDIIKTMATEKHTKAKYDDENQVYKIRLEGDRTDYDDFFAEFEKRQKAEIDAAPENQKWSTENIVHVTSTPEDEVDAMNDLEAHHSNRPLPESRKTKKG